MALNKNKMDIYIKTTKIPNNIGYNEYDWGYYDEYYTYYNSYDYYPYEDNVEYAYLSELDKLDNLLNSTSLLWRKGIYNRLMDLNYKIVDMDSIYNLSKRRQNKIDRILGILDDMPTYNKIEDFINENRDI